MSEIDKDNPEWTGEMFKRSKPASSLPVEILAAFPNTRGAQKAPKKLPISIRLSPVVIEYFKAKGGKWQTRIDDELKKIVEKAG